MTIRYFLRSDKRDAPVTIWARVRTTNDDIRIPTDESIIASQWDKKAGMPRSVNKIWNQKDTKRLTSCPHGFQTFGNVFWYTWTSCRQKERV